MRATISQITLRNFFLLGSISGVFSLFLIFNLPKDPDSNWLLGYSPFRWGLITAAGITLFFLIWLWQKAWRDAKWANKWGQKATARLQRETFSSVVIGVLLILSLLGIWFLISTYTQSPYHTPVRLIASVETVRTYMLRLAPFVFWGTAISLQSLVWLHLCGFGGKDKYHRVVCYISFFVIPFLLVLFFIANEIHPNYYKFITNEDQLVEWATIVSLLMAGVFSLLKLFQIKDYSDHRFWFYLLFSLACVLFVLEEMSWGQRIFELQSPQFFLENSDQQEINVHNVLQEWFSFRTKHVAAWVLFAYGTCLPFLALNRKVKIFFERLGIPIPARFLALGFLLSAILMIDIFSGREEEVGEFCFSVCLFLFMLLEYLNPEKNRKIQYLAQHTISDHPWVRRASIAFVVLGLIITIGLVIFAIGFS